MYVFILLSDFSVCLFYVHCYSPLKGGKTWAFSAEHKIYQAVYTNWMPFLPSKLMEKICPNPEHQSAVPKIVRQRGIAVKAKIIEA